MTPLEALEEIVNDYCIDNKDKELDIIENALKVLEIITKHKLMNYVIKNKKCANMYHLTINEIDLLKEVL